MRTHTLTKIFNTLLVFLATALFIFSFNKLFLEHSKNKINLSNLVGEISHYQKIVQLKHADSIAWNFIDQKEENLVGENDLIFTHANSQATIALKSKQEVTVNSESLVRVKASDTLIVQDGKIEIDIKANQPGLIIQVGTQKYKVKAHKDSKLAIKRGLNQSTFNVKSGEVKLETAKKKLDLKAGTTTQIKNKKIEVTETATQLIYPKDKIILEKSQPLHFEYKSNKEVKEVYLKRADKTFHLAPKETINLRADRYQWGVLYKNSDKVEPEILQDFSLLKLSPAPELLTPPKQASLQIKDSKVFFKWKSPFAVLFELLNSDHETIYSTPVKEDHLTVSVKDSGTYFWRVKIDDDLNQSDYSQENEFFISQLKEIKEFNTVEISKPNQLVNIEFGLEEAKNQPEFILSKTKDFKEILVKKKITSPQMSFKATTPGFYYWKVLDAKGNIELKKIFIIPTPAPTRAPKVKTIIKTIKKKTSLFQKILNILIPQVEAAGADEIEISWEKIEDAKEYEIEIVNNLKRKKVITKLTSQEAKINWQPPRERNYYYRVRYKDYWDRFSPFSPYAQIKIKVVKVKRKRKPKLKAKAKKPILTKVETKAPPIVAAPKETKTRYELGLFYTLSNVDYSQQLKGSTNKVDISGLNSTGHALSLKVDGIFKSNYDLLINYKSRYGKVYNDQQFFQRQIQAAAAKSFHNFQLSLGIEALNLSVYKEGTSKVLYDSSSYGFALTAGISYAQKMGEKSVISPFIQYHKLTYQQFQIGLNYRYHWLKHYTMKISLLMENTTLDVDNQDINSQAYQAFSGLLYHF